MLSGDPIDLERAGALGIIDGESGGEELLEHACRFAREAAGVELDGRRPAAVLEGVHRLGETQGRNYWTPAPLLEELGRSGVLLKRGVPEPAARRLES